MNKKRNGERTIPKFKKSKLQENHKTTGMNGDSDNARQNNRFAQSDCTQMS